MFYVYSYNHPQTGLPFYVGKGSKRRAWIHLNPKKRRDCHFHNTITKIERELQSVPIVKILEENLTEDCAYELEVFLIKKYGRIYYDEGGILTNVDVGGKGPNKRTRERISDSLLGKNFSDAHKSNLSKARKDQKIPPKARMWTVQSPWGEQFTFINLKEFCSVRGLNYDDLKHNLNGKSPIRRGASAGWKCLSAIPYLNASPI